MGKVRMTLLKGILSGVIIAAAIPPTMYWGLGYATAASTSALHSVNEMAGRLTQSMNNRTGTIVFNYEGKTSNLKSQIQAALDQAMSSDPYLHYIIGSYGFSYRGSTRSAKVTVEIKYLETLQQTNFVSQEVKAALKEIIKPGMNSHEKVKAIHDWVVLTLQYDTSYRKYTAYEGLKTGSAVCQGYALLSYKMLKEAGIPNQIVEGTARPEGGRSQSHAWNLVQLDGRWYHLDTTWDDPSPDQAGVVQTGYYLRTDSQMAVDHYWVRNYPAASVPYYQTLSELVKRGGDKTAYYEALQKELHYVLYDEDRVITSASGIMTLAEKAADSGETGITFRYRGSKTSLISDLQQLYDLGFDHLSYQSSVFENTGDLKVSVSWD
ncbi:transglutaminase domain-containing protein [Paenibacillus sp. sgz500958]|uniref:transglutaminase domain-containing protein n=1 Tax=Paenibacillus sp. sgz500958 TaxID=3242475 RepID=UPI0036D3F292